MNSRQSNQLVQSQKLRLTTELAASIRVLRHDATGLTRYLEEQAAINPYLRLDTVQQSEWLPRWSNVFAAQGWGSDASEMAYQARIEAHKPGLMAHASAEIDRLFGPGEAREFACILMNALEPTGWLGKPLAVLAAEGETSLREAEAVLARLQEMEPTGLFARSLAECLKMQAKDAGLEDDVMTCVLDHLDLLAQGDTKRLARMCGVTEAVIDSYARKIRSFDPKPGAQFERGAAAVREPDLLLRSENGVWVVALNRSALPDIKVVPPKGRQRDDATRAALAAARGLARMVDSRNSTILRLGAEIVQRQIPALEQGTKALVPMRMAEVAAALSLHESTVSRAVAGVSMDTPNGTLWLRALFTSAVGPQDGMASGAVRARLARLVAAENPAHPLGDQALADALAKDGAQLARRTITKYREMLHIPPAHRRRR